MVDLYDSGMRPIVDEYLLNESKKIRDYGNYWSASSAGYCMRKNLFERLKVPYVETEADARKQRVFTSGHLFHAWMQGLTKNAGISIVQELELQDEDLMIRGHIDDLIKGKDGLILYDYKTVNSQSFKYKKDKMSHYHRMQLGTYLTMLRKKYPTIIEARILNISKDDLRMSEVGLIWNAMLENDVKTYWKELNDHWEKRTFPECTCDEQENGFMARPQYNPYFYEDEPCSMEFYNKWKEEKVNG